jgi:nucleotide-binding universal stress UspA family protein
MPQPSRPFTPTVPAGRLFLPHRNFTILLALSHDDLAMAAIGMTDLLERERCALPSVVQVFDPAPYGAVHPIPTLMAFAEELIGPQAAQARRRDLQAQLSKVCGHSVRWPITVLMGDPVTCITREARRSVSDLVVVGLPPYGMTNRLLGAEATVRVIANVGLPVLAMATWSTSLPTSIVAAVDFSRASVMAAKAAARLMGESGLLMLVHVQPGRQTRPRKKIDEGEHGRVHDVSAAFSTLAQEIAAETPVTIKTVVLRGEPATALLDYAAQVQPDLLAMGSQHHSVLRQLVVGSVTRRVLRDGRRSVFVVPPVLPSTDDGEPVAA